MLLRFKKKIEKKGSWHELRQLNQLQKKYKKNNEYNLI